MAAAEAAQKICVAMDQLKAIGVRERPLVEVLDLSHQMADSITAFFGSLDKSIIGKFKYLSDFIQKARDEISGLQANVIKDTCLPGASVELDAVVRDTDRATDSIMTEAESLMALEPTDLGAYNVDVDAAVMRIFEACPFQDLTGQRVTKVISTLRHIEERVTEFAGALGVTDWAAPESADDASARELLLNSPAMNGPTTPQNNIDALFS